MRLGVPGPLWEGGLSGQVLPSTGGAAGSGLWGAQPERCPCCTPGALWGHAPLIGVQLVSMRVSAFVGAYDL